MARALSVGAVLGVLGPGAGAGSAPAALYVASSGSDRGSGSAASPLRTIAAAARRAVPGETVFVAPGIYPGGFVTTASGTEHAPITYLSVVKWAARIVPPAAAGPDIGWLNKGSHVTISDFAMDGLDSQATRHETPWRIGIYSSGSDTTIRGNLVRNIALTTRCTDKGGAGIEGDSYYGAHDINLIGNVVHDIGAHGCSFVHGIYETATGSVADNKVFRVSGWGIHLWHDAHDITISDNVVYANVHGGIVVGGGGYVHTTGPADHVTVIGNIVFDNAGIGIAEAGQTGKHNRFMCNISFANGARNWRLLTSKADASGCR